MPALSELSPEDRDHYRVERARVVARLMRRLGWLSAVIGVLSLVCVAILLALGQVDIEWAIIAATGTALVSLTSGAAIYGSSMNVTLTASLLERSYPRVDIKA
jgi:hypothetical protein